MALQPLAVPSPQRLKSPLRGRLEPYLYVLPATLLIASLMVVPIAIVVRYSLLEESVTADDAPFAGLSNYFAVLSDTEFQQSVANTLVFVVVSVLAHLLIGLGFASMLNSPLLHRVPLAIFRGIFLLPWVFTAAVVAVLWRLLLDPDGVINFLLTTVGLPGDTAWLGDTATALGAVTFMNIWAGYPFFMVSLLAGMQTISPTLMEAARVDGAGVIRRFWSVTLPQMRGVIVSMTLLDMIWTSQQFALIWIATGGGPLNSTSVLSTYTYKLAFSSYEFSEAAASAVLVLLISLILAVLYVRHDRKAQQ